jgi:5'-methylthioadenosine phosphorylase
MTEASELKIGIIGGTGLGDALLEGMNPDATECLRPQTPFGEPASDIITGRYEDVPIAILSRHGPGHLHPPSRVPYRANVCALKMLGCTHVIASGATGSLREEFAPSDLVICDQLIDRTEGRPRTFFERAAVHVEFAEPFCPVMRQWLIDHGDGLDGTRVHRAGTYICMEGPTFSTCAESHLYRQWGADLVGMTALPEARLAREAEMGYALIAMPTDYDCWRPRAPEVEGASLLEEIIENLHKATAASIALICAAIRDVDALRENPSPAHDALRSRSGPTRSGSTKRRSNAWASSGRGIFLSAPYGPPGRHSLWFGPPGDYLERSVRPFGPTLALVRPAG